MHDLIKRCDKALQEYEDKLHLLEKGALIRRKADEIRSVIDNSEKTPELNRIRALTESLLEEL